MATPCVVHDRKYLSKFHGAINQLRRTNQFSLSILQKLAKLCCSCQGQTGESSIDLDRLCKLCHQIELSEKPQSAVAHPVKPIPYVILEFPSTLNPIQRIYKAGRFVGRRGQHLRFLERKLNIRINIINQKSKNNSFRRTLNKIREDNKQNHINDLWVFITMKDTNDDQEKVKKALTDQWEKIDVHTKKKQPGNSQQLEQTRPVLTELDGDTRWKPKKQRRTDKNQRKQCTEQKEVAPQPRVPPLSMPKQIEKHEKAKRR